MEIITIQAQRTTPVPFIQRHRQAVLDVLAGAIILPALAGGLVFGLAL